MRPALPAQSKGVALITVLLVVALATIAAAAMATRQQIDMRRTGNVLDGDQAYLYALGAESWAVGILAKDQKENKTDTLGDKWATVLAPIPIEGGEISGAIEDVQGRFNLNNLLAQDGKPSQPDLEMFQRLLVELGLEPNLAQAVLDWIDPDIDPRFPEGAEDDTYLKEQPPYRAANRPMASPTELLLVKGFTADAYARLAPYVTALPTRTTININTASAPVLMALAKDFTASDAEALVEARGQKGFPDVATFRTQGPVAGRTINWSLVGDTSQYFELRAQVHVGQGRAQLSSLLERAQDGKIRTIMRSREIN